MFRLFIVGLIELSTPLVFWALWTALAATGFSFLEACPATSAIFTAAVSFLILNTIVFFIVKNYIPIQGGKH